MKCYFDTGGYGNAFKNPYDAAEETKFFTLQRPEIKKGIINIRHVTDQEVVHGSTATTASGPVAVASSSGFFVVEYYTESGSTGGSGEYKGKMFQLK